MNKATISLNPSSSTVSSNYSGILKSINLCVALATKFLRISQTSPWFIYLDKIVFWSSVHRRLVPRVKTGEDTKTFGFIFFNEDTVHELFIITRLYARKQKQATQISWIIYSIKILILNTICMRETWKTLDLGIFYGGT